MIHWRSFLLAHAHLANWLHFLWGIFIIFPKETIGLLKKWKEAMTFWKEIEEEAKMPNWADVLKDVEKAPAIISQIEKIVGDVKVIEGDQTLSTDVRTLIADVKALETSLGV